MDDRPKKKPSATRWQEWLAKADKLHGHSIIEVPSRFKGIPGCCARSDGARMAIRRAEDDQLVCAQHDVRIVRGDRVVREGANA